MKLCQNHKHLVLIWNQMETCLIIALLIEINTSTSSVLIFMFHAFC